MRIWTLSVRSIRSCSWMSFYQLSRICPGSGPICGICEAGTILTAQLPLSRFFREHYAIRTVFLDAHN